MGPTTITHILQCNSFSNWLREQVTVYPIDDDISILHVWYYMVLDTFVQGLTQSGKYCSYFEIALEKCFDIVKM